MGCAKQDLVCIIDQFNYLHQLYACDRNKFNANLLKEVIINSFLNKTVVYKTRKISIVIVLTYIANLCSILFSL